MSNFFNLFNWLIPVRLDTSKLDQELKEVKSKVQNSEKGITDSLKKTFGEESGFGFAGKLLAGGGLVGGITVLTRALTAAAEATGDLLNRFRDGEISFQEFAGSAVRSIPVLGDLTKLFDEVGHAITGAKKELEEWTNLANQQNAGANLLSDLNKMKSAFGKEGLEKSLYEINEREKEFLAKLSEIPNHMREIAAEQIKIVFDLQRQEAIQKDAVEKEKKRADLTKVIADNLQAATEEMERQLQIAETVRLNEERRQKAFNRGIGGLDSTSRNLAGQIRIATAPDEDTRKQREAEEKHRQNLEGIKRQEEDLYDQIKENQRERLKDAKDFSETLPETFREQFLDRMKKDIEATYESQRREIERASYEAKKMNDELHRATLMLQEVEKAAKGIQKIEFSQEQLRSGVARGLGELVTSRPETPELRELRKQNDRLLELIRITRQKLGAFRV